MNTQSVTVTTPPSPTTLSAQSKNVRAGFFSVAAFELIQRVATGFSRSSLVPKDYRNNIPNCMIAVSMADRIGADPLMVMQNLMVIHGKPTWSAQFLIATANTCGRFDPLQYEFFGEPNTDTWGCRASTNEKGKTKRLVGPDITIEIAKKEGWYNKDGSKWKTIPQLMLMYRAGAWWVRSYAPELSLGLQTAEEAVDVLDATPAPDGSYQVLNQAMQQMAKDPPITPPEDEEPGEPAASSDAAAEPQEAPPGPVDEGPGLDGPEPVQPDMSASQSTQAGAGQKMIRLAIEGLDDPEFQSIEGLDDYNKRVRQNLYALDISNEERMRLLAIFNNALLERKRRLMPKTGRR